MLTKIIVRSTLRTSNNSTDGFASLVTYGVRL